MASAAVLRSSVTPPAMGNGAGLTSAAGLLALLEEEDDRLKAHALEALMGVVDGLWFQVSSSVSLVEALAEDEDFSHNKLAGLLAAKVFYHLGELSESLSYALGAGELFDVNEKSEFVQTLVGASLPPRRRGANRPGEIGDSPPRPAHQNQQPSASTSTCRTAKRPMPRRRHPPPPTRSTGESSRW